MTEPPGVLRVSQFIRLCNDLLDPIQVLVEGEVASYSLNRGKFVFFDLKDEAEDARVGCFMMAHQLPFPLEDGMRVVVRGRPGLYQKSGQFRLLAQSVEAKGEGSLKRAFELLRAKLQAEGMFEQSRKRALPTYPTTVGIISSGQAAGFGDFMRIARERLPGVRFVLCDVAVQGGDAEREIPEAFLRLNTEVLPDVIVLTRGGGSIEDLHAFNSEVVARAIIGSRAPVLVGVGHEKDVTIADYCADVRAATPSNAAQLLLPTKEEVVRLVQQLTVAGKLRVDRYLQRERHGVQQRVGRLGDRLQFSLRSYQQRVESLTQRIDALSPQQVLARGYSITRAADGSALTALPTPGQALLTRMQGGSFTSHVD